MRRFALVALLLIGCSEHPPPGPSRPVASANPPATAAKMVDTKSPAPVAPPAEPGPPDRPPYDIAADREQRVKTAKAELGAKTTTSVVSDIFVIVNPPGANNDASINLMRSAMAGFMNGRFDQKPEQAISVYLFPTAQGYEQFCAKKYNAPCIAHFGFYQPTDRYMVMNIGLGLGTLTHEIVHPLVEADFPGAPTWINEGIASVFEQPQIPKAGEIHGGKNWRHPRLKKALTTPEKDKARLDRFFGMKDEVFRGDDEDLHYAAARYICQWLDERGKLWAFYHRWRDNVTTDPTGEKSFKEVVGMTPAQAHPDWAKWVLAL